MEATMNMMADGRRLDPRLIAARSWWLATTLCRRHDDLTIIEWHPGGGQYDNLGLYSAKERAVVIDLNREGSLHRGLKGRLESISWADAFACEPIDTVHWLEAKLRFQPANHSLSTSPKLLTYRVLSAFSALGSTERFPWKIQSAFLDTSGHSGGPNRDLLAKFQGASERRESYPDHILGDASHGFWVLSRDGRPEIMLDDSGTLYRQTTEPKDLYSSFHQDGRQLWRVMGHEFGPELG